MIVDHNTTFQEFRSSDIKTITLTNNVTDIGEESFAFCANLEEFQFSVQTKAIHSSAFRSCTKLSMITDIIGLLTLEDHAFYKCSALKEIDLSKTTIEDIPDACFFKCTSLEKILFPKSLKTIKNDSFAFCSSLQSITIPDNVEVIEGFSFANCKNLQSIKFMNCKTKILPYAFVGCDNLININGIQPSSHFIEYNFRKTISYETS